MRSTQNIDEAAHGENARAGEASPMSRPLLRALLSATTLLATLGLVAEISYFRGTLSSEATAFLSLSAEGNLPTWYATCLLFWCGISLAEIGALVRPQAHGQARSWFALAITFLFMSLDEAVEIHEHLGGLFEGRGVLFFSWVIPASGIVLIGAAASFPFLRALPRITRIRFLAAGGLYVGGALGMELPLGFWAEQRGDENLTYALLDLVEETLELAGASLFLAALEAHRRTLLGEASPR